MYCRDCARYDPETAKCRDGKVNPGHYEAALNVARLMGLRAICVFCDHRERLVANIHDGSMRAGRKTPRAAR